ncbi:MAG: O-antigen ligase family protein [Solirubrobacteraceae bacterium]|nr:O-antigen ligase family protein [Solirubrobacteraceae bacterium]
MSRIAIGAPTTLGVQIGGALVISILGGALVAFVGDPVLLLAVVAAAGLVAAGLLRPALFLALLLILRPVLDGPGGNAFSDAPSANPAGLLGLVLIAVLVILLVTKRRFAPPPATLAFVALLLASAVAAFLAVLSVRNIGFTPISELIRLSAMAAIYVLASQMVTDPKRLQGIFVVVGLSAIVPALVGVYELIEGPEPVVGFDIGRINGTFVGPLPFSAFIAVCALVLASLPRAALSPWIRWPTLTLLLVTLVASYSREGWILFLVGFALLRWRTRPQLVLATVIACAIVVAAVPNVQHRVLPSATTQSGTAAYDSLDWRFANWRGLLAEYERRPLTGWGLKSTRHVNPRAPVSGRAYAAAGGGYEAHNLGVRALVEGGPLLLAAYLVLLGAIILALRRIARDRAWPQRDLARVVLCLWIALAIIAFAANDPFEQTAMMYAVLALTGAVAGAYRHWRETA